MLNYDVRKIYAWPMPVQWLIFFVTMIVILFLGYFFHLLPYKNNTVLIAQQEADLKRQLKLIIEKRVMATNDISQAPTIKKVLADWQKNIITKSELPSLLDEILKLGENNHLKVTLFNPANEVKDGIYSKTPVSMSISGNYDQIATFISQLVNMPKLVSLEAFTIVDDNDQTTLNAHQLNSSEIMQAQLAIGIYRK